MWGWWSCLSLWRLFCLLSSMQGVLSEGPLEGTIALVTGMCGSQWQLSLMLCSFGMATILNAPQLNHSHCPFSWVISTKTSVCGLRGGPRTSLSLHWMAFILLTSHSVVAQGHQITTVSSWKLDGGLQHLSCLRLLLHLQYSIIFTQSIWMHALLQWITTVVWSNWRLVLVSLRPL